MVACCIQGCSSVYSEFKPLAFYLIPEKLDIRKKWLEKLKQSLDKNPERLNKAPPHVCSLHFRNSDFIVSKSGSMALKTNALPTQNLDPESDRRVSNERFMHPIFKTAKRKVGRPRKEVVLKPKRKRGRPRKNPVSQPNEGFYTHYNLVATGSHFISQNECCASNLLYREHGNTIKTKIYDENSEENRTLNNRLLFPNCVNKIPLVYTTKLDDMNIPKKDIINGVRNKKIIDWVMNRSKPKFVFEETCNEIPVKTERLDEIFIVENSEIADIIGNETDELGQDDMIVLRNPNNKEVLNSTTERSSTPKTEKNKEGILNNLPNDLNKHIVHNIKLEETKSLDVFVDKIPRVKKKKSSHNSTKNLTGLLTNIFNPPVNRPHRKCIIIYTLASDESEVYIVSKTYKLLECMKYPNKFQPSNYKRSCRIIEVDTCCWFRRESDLMACKDGNMTLNSITFLNKRHECPPESCICCCKNKVCVNEKTTPLFIEETILKTCESALLMYNNQQYIGMPSEAINVASKISSKYIIRLASNQEVELYEVGTKENNNNLVLTGYSKLDKTMVNWQNLVHKAQMKSFFICCWASRQICIETLQVENKLPSDLAKFISKPHTCRSLCSCCCLEELNRILVKSRPKQLTLKCLLKRQTSLKFDFSANMTKFRRDFKFQQLAFDISDSFMDGMGVNASKYNSLKPFIPEELKALKISNTETPITRVLQTVKTSIPETPKTCPGLRNRTKYSEIPSIPEEPNVSKISNSKTSIAETPKNCISDSPDAEVNLLIATILERFKDVKLNVKSDGKVCATINSSNKLTVTELKILGGLVTHAQKIVDELGIEPGTNMPLGLENISGTKKIPISQPTFKQVQTIPATCQPIISNVVGNAEIHNVETDYSPSVQIINVRSLNETISVLSHNTQTQRESFDNVINVSKLREFRKRKADMPKIEGPEIVKFSNFSDIIDLGDDEYVLSDDTPRKVFIEDGDDKAFVKKDNFTDVCNNMIEDFQNTLLDSTEEEIILGV